MSGREHYHPAELAREKWLDQNPHITTCPDCWGRGVVKGRWCHTCEGEGVIPPCPLCGDPVTATDDHFGCRADLAHDMEGDR